jgi:hypothetical protein
MEGRVDVGVGRCRMILGAGVKVITDNRSHGFVVDLVVVENFLFFIRKSLWLEGARVSKFRLNKLVIRDHGTHELLSVLWFGTHVDSALSSNPESLLTRLLPY